MNVTNRSVTSHIYMETASVRSWVLFLLIQLLLELVLFIMEGYIITAQDAILNLASMKALVLKILRLLDH